MVRVKLTTTEATTIYTVPTGKEAYIKFFHIVNDTDSVVNAAVWILNSSAVKSGIFMSYRYIEARDGFQDSGLRLLIAGESVVAQIDTAQDVFVELTIFEETV